MEQDLTVNFNIDNFTHVVSSAFDPTCKTHAQSQRLLINFKESPNAWIHINTILTQTQDQNAHYIALQILEQAIKTRWNTFPPKQKESLRNFIIQQILNRAKSDTNSVVLEKFNISLVEVLKRDWPRNWSTFISDLVNASQNNGMEVCTNSLHILRRLNEEIFVFSEITTVRRRLLIAQLKSEFMSIYTLIINILEWSKNTSVTDKLMNAVFSTLESFSLWMPISFFCESNILEHVAYYINSRYSLSAIKCLTKIVSKRNKKDKIKKTEDQFTYTTPEDNTFFCKFEEKILFLHIETIKFLDLYFNKFSENALHNVYDAMDRLEKEFTNNVSVLLCTFYENLVELEKKDLNNVKKGMRYLIQISKIEDDKIFKDNLDFFKKFTSDLYVEYPYSRKSRQIMDVVPSPHSLTLRRDYYESILKGLIELIISKMPRPEEVFITENEYGEIVKEKMTESDQIEHYKNMKETFFFLSFLNKEFTIKIIYERVSNLFSTNKFSYDKMNKICWSAGCVAGALEEREESDFFVGVLKELLTLCEIKYTKSDKAIIASNIMFLIGQFDRFLMANNKFLKTVIKKLFEFMSENHEGIKDMACDTFLKVSMKCQKIFITQMEGNENYMLFILKGLKEDTKDLEYYQKRIVYQAICNILQSVQERQRVYFLDLLVGCFACDLNLFSTKESFNAVCHCLRSYSIIYDSIPESINYNVNFLYSLLELFEKCLFQQDKNTNLIRIELVRLFTVIVKQGKKVVIDLSFVHALFDKVLVNYKVNDDGVYLNLCNEIVNNIKLENDIQRDSFIVSNLLEANEGKVGCNDERARGYFMLVLSLFNNSFDTIFPVLLSNSILINHVFKNILNGLVLEKEINENCLEIIDRTILKCYELRIYLFFQTYILIIIENLLGILFDKDKSYSLEKQCHLFCNIMKIISDKNMMQLDGKYDNINLIGNNIKALIQSNFKNITEDSLNVFLLGLINLNQDVSVFKDHVCDFRVKIYEFFGNEDVEDELKLLEERKSEIARNLGN
ncbi:Exportin-1 [Conglomerata obtusa]